MQRAEVGERHVDVAGHDEQERVPRARRRRREREKRERQQSGTLAQTYEPGLMPEAATSSSSVLADITHVDDAICTPPDSPPENSG